MSVIRVNKTKDYTVMSNHHLKNRNLSLKAKGLLSQMLALPEGWDYSINGLVAINKESEASIKAAMSELKAEGYLRITKLKPNQTESGRIEYVYDIYEEPKQEGEKQEVEIQPLEIQPIENHGQLNTNKLNTNNKINNINKERKKEAETFDGIIAEVPEVETTPELKTAIQEFIKMRKLIKAPLTNGALRLNIETARKIADGDPEEMAAVFLQSVQNSWRGVYPLKIAKETAPHKKDPQSARNPFTDLLAAEGYT